jgi:thiamine transport system permease protein
LGSTGWERWKSIEWPLLRSALGTGLAFAAALSLGDLSSVLILGEGELITLPVAIYRLIGQYRFAYALALGTIFIGLAFMLFLMIERLSRRSGKTGETR